MNKKFWSNVLAVSIVVVVAWAGTALYATSQRNKATRSVSEQYAVAVWDRVCLDNIVMTQDTKMEAPLNQDGTPDIKNARIRGLHATFSLPCYRIEIRRHKVDPAGPNIDNKSPEDQP